MCGFEINTQDFFNEAAWIILLIAEDVDTPPPPTPERKVKKRFSETHNFIVDIFFTNASTYFLGEYFHHKCMHVYCFKQMFTIFTQICNMAIAF